MPGFVDNWNFLDVQDQEMSVETTASVSSLGRGICDFYPKRESINHYNEVDVPVSFAAKVFAAKSYLRVIIRAKYLLASKNQ